MKLKGLLIGLALAAGFAASLAAAAVPAKHGPPTVSTASTSTSTSTSTPTTKSKGKKPPATGLGCRPKVALVLKGSLLSAAATSFGMKVTQTNRHAYVHAGLTVTVNVDAKTKVVRRGPSTLEKLVVGDRLNVQARACKAERDTAVLLATRVVAQPAKASTTTGTTGTTEGS